MADIAELIVALRLRDGVSPGLGRLNGQLRGMQGGLSQVGRGVGQVGSGITRLGERAALAAAGGLTAVVTTAASFESAFAGVAKTVDATGPQLEELESQFRALAREIPLSFEELAAIGETGGAIGIAREDLIEFTEVVAQLAATTDLTADAAAISLGQLQNVLGLTSEDFDNFGAALVDLGNKGASTESQIVDIASRIGAAGNLVGLTADEVLGFGAAVANLGIEAEAGGSAIQRFLLGTLKNLQDDTTLAVMADTAGVTGQAFKRAFEDDAAGALQTFLLGLGELQKAEQLAVLEALGFNDVRITRALLGLAGDAENLSDALDNSAEGWIKNTALIEEFRKRQETTAALWQVFKNNARDALATVGFELLPVANDLMKDFVATLNEPGTRAGLTAFAKDLAEGVRGLAAELKGTDFSGVIGGIKVAAQVAKTAFDAFRALPEPIQQLAVAAFAVNKLSGGAIGQIAGGLGNILLGSLKTITAANVTVIGGRVSSGPQLPTRDVTSTLKTAGALAAIPLAGAAAIMTVEFAQGNAAQLDSLGAKLDALPRRSAAELSASIAKVEGAIEQANSNLLTSELSTRLGINARLDAELRELVQLRSTSADLSREQMGELIRIRNVGAQVANISTEQKAELQRHGGILTGFKSPLASLPNIASATQQARELANIANAYNARTASASEITSRKNFSPSVNVNLDNFVNVALSASAVALQVQRVTQTTNVRSDINEVVF
jgi:TP901 family phage tail tape measure protein